jgi:hypothetical protein
MSVNGLNPTSAAWAPQAQTTVRRNPMPATVSLGMTFGEFMRVGPWASRRGTVPAQTALPQPPVQPDAEGLRPVNRPQAPVRFQPTISTGPSVGVAATGLVTGQQKVVTAGVQAATANAISNFHGLAWAGLAAANGNRDTTVLVPQGVDLSKPVEVIVYFHGNGGSSAASTKELRSLIEQLPAHGRNAIMVIPTTPANKATWMSPTKGESLTRLQDEAVATVSQMTGRQVRVGSYTVEGFSGGGLPVATAAKAGQLRANHINLFDSTYGEWGDITVRNRQPGATVNVFYTDHNRERASRLRGKPGVTLEASRTNHGGTPGMYFFR